MNKTKVFVFLLVMIAAGTIGFVSCQKQQKEVRETKNPSVLSRNGNYLRIKAAFRWDGVLGNGSSENCRGGDCGQCPGICLIIQFSITESNVTPEEYAQGYGTAFIWIENNQLVLQPDRSIDNGDGKVRITSDFQIGTDVSAHLGYSAVTIQSGTYTIDYNTQNPFGIVRFNISCQ